MLRLLYEKTGDGVFLSHLDLIRLFQRTFRRAGVMLKHSQGFSPKPYVSVAMPLSVGMHSICEILDFELEGDIPVPADLVQRLNATLPRGIIILEQYESQRKVREITYLSAASAWIIAITSLISVVSRQLWPAETADLVP